MRNRRSPVLTCCPSVKLRSWMKPATRATTSTLLIALTRPTKSPVAVIWRLCTGRTDTAGGGAPCAMAAPQQTIETSAPIAADVAREQLRRVINPPKPPPGTDFSHAQEVSSFRVDTFLPPPSESVNATNERRTRARCCRRSSAQGFERRAQLGREQLRLLPRREVTAAVDFVEINEVAIGTLGP